MIATRGLGRSGAAPSYLVTSGLGRGSLLELEPYTALATVDTLDDDLLLATLEQDLGLETLDRWNALLDGIDPELLLAATPPATLLPVQEATLQLEVEPIALALDVQEGGLSMLVTPIQTVIHTAEELIQSVTVNEPAFALDSTDEHLSLATDPPDLVLVSITEDLEVLDADQPLLLDQEALRLLLSTTPLKGPE